MNLITRKLNQALLSWSIKGHYCLLTFSSLSATERDSICQKDIIDKHAVEIYNNIIVKSNDFKYFVKSYKDKT